MTTLFHNFFNGLHSSSKWSSKILQVCRIKQVNFKIKKKQCPGDLICWLVTELFNFYVVPAGCCSTTEFFPWCSVFRIFTLLKPTLFTKFGAKLAPRGKPFNLCGTHLNVLSRLVRAESRVFLFWFLQLCVDIYIYTLCCLYQLKQTFRSKLTVANNFPGWFLYIL